MISQRDVHPSEAGAAQRSYLSGWRLDLLVTLLGLLGLAIFLIFYDRAFPSAAIDLDLSRAEIAQRAQAYLESQGYNLEDYEFALSFQQDGWASVFLQRTLGIPETNRLVRTEGLPIWTWEARWFRPLQQEEFSVSLTTDGEVIGFSRSLPEDAPGAGLPQKNARTLAETYLVEDRGWLLDDWELTTASTQEQTGGRVDHYFEWKRRDFAVGAGDLRLSLGMQGDRVGDYYLWLRVPEAFERHFSEESNRAGFFGGLSSMIGFYLFGLAGLLAYLMAVWRGGLPWYAGLVPAMAVAVVSLLAGLNELPLRKAWYSTTQDYLLYWLQQAFLVLSVAVSSAVPVLILWAGGRRLAKGVWPRQDKILPRGDHPWEILARYSWRGVMLGGLLAGYVVLFYLVAIQLFGGWTPLDVPYTGWFATPFPFLGPLELGLRPAMHEELFYRLIGISLLLLLMRRRWLALLIPGALWGFAHLTYVRDPFYLRGIELTIASVFLLGIFFLRFGLVTTIMAHFAYNAGTGALPLLRSGEPYFIVSGIIVFVVILAPVIPGAIAAIRRKLRGGERSFSEPRIRPGTVADLEKLEALPIEGLDRGLLLDDSAAVVICLEADDELVGVAAGRVTAEDTGEMLAVYVAPAWRRRYWASTLVDALCADLRAQGARSVQATAQARDRVASSFLASQGWGAAVKVFSRSLTPPPRLGWRDSIGKLRDALRTKTGTLHNSQQQG